MIPLFVKPKNNLVQIGATVRIMDPSDEHGARLLLPAIISDLVWEHEFPDMTSCYLQPFRVYPVNVAGFDFFLCVQQPMSAGNFRLFI